MKYVRMENVNMKYVTRVLEILIFPFRSITRPMLLMFAY